MKLKAITLTALLAGSLPVYAGFMMGGAPGGSGEALETVISSTDEATAAALQSQRDAVADLQSQLETLLDADERDDDAISDVRSQLHEARHELRSEVHEIVDANEELKTALHEQREAARSERAVTGYALRDDEAYASLLGAASEEQSATLEANQQAIEDLKTQANEAKAAGATREEMHEYREQIRTLASEQADTVSAILEANEDLQSEFTAATEGMVSDMRPPRRGGRH